MISVLFGLVVLTVSVSGTGNQRPQRLPYYYFDDFGAYYGRFSCPSQMTGASVPRNQRLFDLMTSEIDCQAFQKTVNKSEPVFKRLAASSHANQVKALGSLLFHSSPLACSDHDAAGYAWELLEGLLETPQSFKNYFEATPNPAHYLSIARDIMSNKSASFEGVIQVILKNEMRPMEFAFWIRVALLSARSYSNYGFALDGVKNALRGRHGVNLTPDMVELLGEVYFLCTVSPNSTKKYRLLRAHAEEMLQLGFADLMISTAVYLETTVEKGVELAEIVLGEHFKDRPTLDTMFPEFKKRQDHYLLHAPLLDDDVDILSLGPTSLSIQWKQQQGRTRRLDLKLDQQSLIVDSTFLASFLILRQNSTDMWEVIDLGATSYSSTSDPEPSQSLPPTASSAIPSYQFSSSFDGGILSSIGQKSSGKKLQTNDIIVFLDSYPVDQSELLELVMHKKSTRETALILQAALYKLKLIHHVMIVV